MEKDIKRILLSEEEIKAIVQNLAEQIDRDYQGKKLVMVGLLKGSVVFMADLMRALKTRCRIDFMVT